MPLDERGNPWKPVQFPDEIENDDSLFRMRFTGEVFLCYEDYLDQLQLYMKRIWMCSYTGRSSMTFEEYSCTMWTVQAHVCTVWTVQAHVQCGLHKLMYRHPSPYVQALECEHTVEYMAGLFPQEFASEALLYIHRSALNLEHLVMKLQHHFEPFSKEVFGEKPLELQKEILQSFIVVNITSLPTEGRQVIVKTESLKKYNLIQPVANVQTSAHVLSPSKVKTEGAFSLVHSPSLGNTRLHPLPMTSRTSNAEMEGIVAMDTGPPGTSSDPDPFPDITGDLIYIWKNIANNSDIFKCSNFTFSMLYKSLLKASNVDQLADIYIGLLNVVFQEIARNIILQSERMPHYFRRANEQNWEEKMGTYLVALSKAAEKSPKEFCGVGDDLLGDCCRETGEDWSLTNLSVRSKTSLLKFLVSQSMKTDLLKSPSNNGSCSVDNRSPPQAKRKQLSTESVACKNEDDPCNNDWAGPETPCQKPVYVLGKDRCHSEYSFIPTMAERLFVRSKVSNKWSFYNQPEQVDQLMCYLEACHHGEQQLKENIQKHLHQLKDEMEAIEKTKTAAPSLRRSSRSKSEY